VVAGAAAAALALLVTDGVLAAGRKAPHTILASAVPMPRPSPLRDNAPTSTWTEGDAIGALIASVDGSESRASEDSDAPQATAASRSIRRG
jgi:hypothetical protein